ncbi:CFEM domain-containing protein [Dactylonectria estremocensis]|uniref:CFEM domain-containing protein n=1 Tax=Dactylonectria estremocensis TaxID=1079267 RepID=A0A9P9I720_9HYPO|nr:CFEM domain-containing protein [Dactylonectria estremocensis]
MVALLSPLLLLALMALSSLTKASPHSPDSLGLPSCSTRCIGGLLDEVFCDTAIQTCVCMSEQFQKDLTYCVMANCQIPEALLALNISHTACGSTVRDRSQTFIITTGILLALASIFVIMRFSYKHFARMEFRWDDWVVLATMVSATTVGILSIHDMGSDGLGRDVWTRTPENISSFAFHFYLLSIFYFLSTALIKEALVLFYIYIFPAQRTQRLLRVTAAFIAAHGLVFTLISIFQCRPIQYVWSQWAGASGGSCISINPVSWSSSVLSVVLDLWILAIPSWELRHLQLHWKKKVGVGVMFCAGTLVTVISILRFQSIVTFAKSPNITWDYFDISLWSMAEILVGVICTCLPVFRLLVVRLFPALSGSSHHSSRGCQHQYQSNGRFTNVLDRSHGTSIVASTRLPAGNSTSTSGQGILLQKTFEVQYGDGDEISLVYEMSDLSPACNARSLP